MCPTFPVSGSAQSRYLALAGVHAVHDSEYTRLVKCKRCVERNGHSGVLSHLVEPMQIEDICPEQQQGCVYGMVSGCTDEDHVGAVYKEDQKMIKKKTKFLKNLKKC